MQDTALGDQFALALISTYALQWLKRSKFFPWLTVETQALNRFMGAAIALLSSVGILVSFDHATGVLTISGLTAVNLLHAAARFAQQWALQQAAYKGLVAPPMPGAMQAGAEKHPPVITVEETKQ